jgi:GNAT superfamily N-acetyltransferase
MRIDAPRPRARLGDGLVFEVQSSDAWLEAEAIDATPDGLHLAVVHAAAELVLPAVGEVVTVSCTAGVPRDAVVRHVGTVRTDRGTLPAMRIERRASARFAAGSLATASSPWFFGESVRLAVVQIGAGGMTVRSPQGQRTLVAGMELDLQLAFGAVRGRLTSVRRHAGELEVGVAWIDPPPELSHAIAHQLLAGDTTLTPAIMRDGGLDVGRVDRLVSYDEATSSAEREAVLALRLHAHQAQGHLLGESIDELRSPFDAHARHLTCGFGGRIVGYVRVIFVDGDPARSQYVTLGGHEVPPWLWEAGFVEAGAGAIDPDFQGAGLFTPLMARSIRVAVQSGHRYVLGACDDRLLAMYGAMGFERLESRIVEPKPGWRFRSHLIYLDAERDVAALPAAA